MQTAHEPSRLADKTHNGGKVCLSDRVQYNGGPDFLLLFPSFMSAYHNANNSTCQTNVHQLSTTLTMYAQDWDETLPPSAHWADAALTLKPVTVKTFHCPEAKSPYSYVFNKHLDRLRLRDVSEPSQIPMVYEGYSVEFNAASDGKAIPPALRHNVDATIIGFADGHSKRFRESTLGELNWTDKAAPESDPLKP